MKVFLMHRDRDFDPDAELPSNVTDLRRDLELDRLLDAMGHGDTFLRGIAEHALFNGLTQPDAIIYRQHALRDCLDNPQVILDIHEITSETLQLKRKNMFWLSDRSSPDQTMHRSLGVLAMFVDAMEKLRRIAEVHGPAFHSDAFTALFATLTSQLDEQYLRQVREHLALLHFARGTLLSARLSRGNSATDYLLRKPAKTGLLDRINQRSYTFRIPPRDTAGSDALAAIRGHGIMDTAQSLLAAAEHVSSFFWLLRAESAFYVACLNLYRELDTRGESTCFPTPKAGGRSWQCRGLYDPCLRLGSYSDVVGNDVAAPNRGLVMITGANQGGKSTFLRGVGLAQLMMQAGMFVAAREFHADIRSGVFTHFKREEDSTMTHGKFDEELDRMSALVNDMDHDALLLCNESLASTNEREGSAIAAEVIAALTDIGVKIFYVTHMYDLAAGLYGGHDDAQLFLRADRGPDGTRNFRLSVAPPLATSYGDDSYRRVFGTAPEADLVAAIDH